MSYYDGFVRVGVVHEQYDDMLLVKRVAVNRNNLAVLLDVVFEEIGRIQKFEDTEKQRRDDMLTTSKSLSEKLVTEEEVVEGDTTNDDFAKLKFEFKNQSVSLC